MELKDKCLCEYIINPNDYTPDLDYETYRKCRIVKYDGFWLDRYDFEFSIPISYCPFCGRELNKKEDTNSNNKKYYFKQNPKGFIRFKENYANNFDGGKWYCYEYYDSKDSLLIDNVGMCYLDEILKVKFEIDKVNN